MTDTTFPAARKKTKGYLRQFARKAPATMRGFAALHEAAQADGVLDTKTKELIALAIAVAMRCDDCIAFHVNDALRAGASEPEIHEALGVAVLMGGGPAMMYTAHVLEAVEQFNADK